MTKRVKKALRVALFLLLFVFACEVPFYTGPAFYALSSVQSPDKQPEIFSRPCYEFFSSFTSGRRFRTDETGFFCRAVWSAPSRMEGQMIKKALEVARFARHHAWKTYREHAVNEITAGGKNVIREFANLMDWQETLRQSDAA